MFLVPKIILYRSKTIYIEAIVYLDNQKRKEVLK